jgi:uncharacterized membrane protein YgcG
MKKLKQFIFFFLLMAPVYGQSQGFLMERFNIDIYIRAQGYFDVVESYDVNFQVPKHGLYREFFTRFDFQDENGNLSKRQLYITDIEVPGQSFQANSGLLASLQPDKTIIKIGDKNREITGPMHYEIRYRVKNALIFTDSLAILYWNAKPSGWQTVFTAGSIQVHAPKGSSLTADNCFLYAGDQADSMPSSAFSYQYTDSVFAATARQDFFSAPGQSITVLVKLPVSQIRQVDFTPPFWERHLTLAAALLFIMLFTLWAGWRIWRSRVTPVTAYYPPEDLDPAMAGVLIDNLTNARDISSLLPYWAGKGYLKMEAIPQSDRSIKDNLSLIYLSPLPEQAPGYQHNLFQKIFLGGLRPVALTSNLQGCYQEALLLLIRASKSYYRQKRNRALWIVLALSWLWAFFSISFFPVLMQNYINMNVGGFIAFLILNFIFFFFIFPISAAFIVKRYRLKNAKGEQLTAELLGFREFIKTAELGRIKMLLKDDPEYFEKTMPYAMAFGMLKQWSLRFESLGMATPGWYSGGSHVSGYSNLHLFTQSFQNSMAAAQSTMGVVISPSSGSSRSSSSHSGGGFSGGGSGGGGGGSW